MNHVAQPFNVPSRTSAVHPDVKMQALYQKLQGPMRKYFDFVKNKFFKHFCPSYSKYFDDVEHRACWHCGNIGHLRPVCPKWMHMRGDVPSNVYPSV